MKRCDFYKDMVEAQNKVDRWNLKEVVTENVQRNVKTTYKNRQERFDYIKCILCTLWTKLHSHDCYRIFYTVPNL